VKLSAPCGKVFWGLVQRNAHECGLSFVSLVVNGLGLNDFAAAQAGGAYANALARALHLGVNGTQIYIPASLGHVVGVADVVPKLRPFAAYFANLCHDCSE
jgi:hypothetical protein